MKEFRFKAGLTLTDFVFPAIADELINRWHLLSPAEGRGLYCRPLPMQWLTALLYTEVEVALKSGTTWYQVAQDNIFLEAVEVVYAACQSGIGQDFGGFLEGSRRNEAFRFAVLHG